ncbi:MAG: heavy-metal-associated domain-containing protein [Anaerolineae bacterium]|nr:heavy-metal-associated domain-containing protein [Anaerolineae bacterium]
MNTITLEVPALYGDHHVVEVRRILLALPGVKEVYASSAFQVLQVTHDPAQCSAGAIKAALAEAGYLEDFAWPEEVPAAAYNNPDGIKSFFRHTIAFSQTQHTVGFGQTLPYNGRPLWPCPGMGPVRIPDAPDTADN